MMGLLSQVPGRLLGALLVSAALLLVLTPVLAWHGVRRLLDVPRVPRPRAMYLVFGGAWLVALVALPASVEAIALLRDYRSADRPTALADVRCAATDGARVRLELRTAPLAPPERYDVDGDRCVVWVEQVELRPGLQGLGIHTLSRVERVGSVARPAVNPDWLKPEPRRTRRLLDLVVRARKTVAVAVPPDADAHLVLVASPDGPTIQPSTI